MRCRVPDLIYRCDQESLVEFAYDKYLIAPLWFALAEHPVCWSGSRLFILPRQLLFQKWSKYESWLNHTRLDIDGTTVALFTDNFSRLQ